MKRYIIPVFIPHHGCPHQCVFCDQRAITGTVLPPTAREVTDAIRSRLARLTQPRAVEIAFYGGSFTALPAARQHELLAPAARARARGEVGLLVLETSAVAWPVGATSIHQPALSDDRFVPGLTRLAEAVHAHGARMVVQMCHHGKTAGVDAMQERPQLVPSVPLPEGHDDISLTLRHAEDIDSFEAARPSWKPVTTQPA